MNTTNTSTMGARVRSLFLAFGCSLLLGAACPTSAHVREPQPDLCDIDGGRLCTPCGGVNEPECPQGDSGWLCCSGGVCVAVPTTGECTGTVGWCSNYTTEQKCNEAGWCTDVATCHDGD